MDVTRAMADLDEVRSRLASVQRLRGLSGPAAAISGFAALACGAAQWALLPHPATAADGGRYVVLGMSCLAFALAINYGSLGVWLARNWSSRTRSELRTAAVAISPSVVAGGAFTAALISRGEIGMLPGTWALCYALGLLASRTMLPRGIVSIAFGFAALGALLLFARGSNALVWWVMPLTFGFGQLAIGVLIERDEFARKVTA